MISSTTYSLELSYPADMSDMIHLNLDRRESIHQRLFLLRFGYRRAESLDPATLLLTDPQT